MQKIRSISQKMKKIINMNEKRRGVRINAQITNLLGVRTLTAEVAVRAQYAHSSNVRSFANLRVKMQFITY